MVQEQAYGTWESPISPQLLADGSRLNDAQWDSDGTTLVWSARQGTGTRLLAQQGTDAPRQLLDSSYKIGGRVGYGGGEFTVADGVVYFISKGHLHRLPLDDGLPQVLTPRFGGTAHPTAAPDGDWVAFVHTYQDQDVVAIVDSHGKMWPQKIAQGYDFYMQPTWHPDSRRLAFVAWNHPNMPWNSTELHIVTLQRTGNAPLHTVAEEILINKPNVAIYQPSFSPDGRYLAYVSDQMGYGHLYLYDLETKQHKQITHGAVEHIMPAWIQGLHTYGWTGDGSAIYYVRHQNAIASVWMYDVAHEASLQVHELDDYTEFASLSVAPDEEKLAVIASASTIPARLLTYSAEAGVRVAQRATLENMPAAYLSPAEPITWTGHDGEDVHGLYYAPNHPDYTGIDTPPLMVLVHGGPTSQRMARYDDEVQFFTSRGFAVLQVNHRGSTGYGKAYMDKHAGNWGVYDVQDSITGAQHLVDAGLAHRDKLVIMGGSAGGYTVLQAMVDEPGFFKAGVCSYGVANQYALATDTHKFESRYSEWLLGTLPQATNKYHDRSPLFHAHRIEDALLIFQGADDKVVPQNQSDTIVQALRRNGTPHDYIVYEGEGHGFRKQENVIDFYERIVTFLTEQVIFAPERDA